MELAELFKAMVEQVDRFAYHSWNTPTIRNNGRLIRLQDKAIDAKKLKNL